MGTFAFRELKKPFPAHMDVLKQALKRDPHNVKRINICCGLGWGKTVLGIQLACLAMNSAPGQVGLFLEPDWDRINTIFLPEWQRIVPEELYTIEKGCIKWYNGSVMYFRPRVVSGSKEHARDRFRGLELTFVISDEEAVSHDTEQYTNILGRIRRLSDIRFFVTLSTPKIGAYGRLLKMPGQRLIRGKTSDNPYLPNGYEDSLRAVMSTEQARRELEGELVALEGRIWSTCKLDVAWPHGNRNDRWKSFRPNKPWWLFCDYGSQFGAYVVVQKMDSNGRFNTLNNVWTAVADLCPNNDASASRAFARLNDEFGTPVAVVGGKDVNTHGSGSGKTIAYFANQVWSGVHVLPTDETNASRLIQHDALQFLMRSSLGERRFTVARDFVSLEPDSRRGIKEMIDEDAWPTENQRTMGQLLPKHKSNVVQHVRDALLNGSTKIMHQPIWMNTNQRPG